MEFWALLLLTISGLASSSDVIARIEQGLIKGITLQAVRSNQTYFGFMGIPYAKPPVGNLRFKRAEPPDSWTGIRDATRNGNVCPQFNVFGRRNIRTSIGNEDCLYINVYTPKLPRIGDRGQLSVMVWFHGGEFLYGSGDRDIYGPDYFIDENVVLVTLNYRLGILGFLSLQNNQVPGNNGLKDQVLALRWVKKNIDKFGGDRNKITIFGESAGAACVHYHLLSPQSRGLFHSAISQSGSALNSWSFQTPESTLNLTLQLAKYFGQNTTDPSEILKVLMKVHPRDLVQYTLQNHYKARIGPLAGPTLDTKGVANDVFLPDIPIKLINSGRFFKVPYITGMNSEEAILFTRVLKEYERYLSPVAIIFRFVLPLYVGQQIPKVKEMANEVKNRYFSGSESLILKYINVITDMFFGNGIYCAAMKHAKYSTAYSYVFSFNGTANILKILSGGQEFPGACHADELPYMFTFSMLNISIPTHTPEYITSRRIVRLWTNFAKFGQPTPKPETLLQNMTWYPVNETASLPYFNIDNDLSIRHDLNGLWWQQLFKNFTPEISPCWTAHDIHM